MSDANVKKVQKEQDERWGELMQLAQNGDEMAFNNLFTEISPIILAFCGRRASYLGIPEETLQESLIALHRNRAVYIPGRSFKAWMFSIVRSKLIDQLRKKMVIDKHTEAHQENQENPLMAKCSTLKGRGTISVKPKDDMGADNTDPKIVALKLALSQLPEKYRSVLMATKIQGKSVQETALELGISESAVKVRTHRGYKKLVSKLEQSSGD